MRKRLDEIVLAALAGKELEVTAQRVTAPDLFGISQFTTEEMDVAVDGNRSRVILDFLIEGEIARVSLNGLYKTSIPVSPSLIEQDAFAVVYTTAHSAYLPLTLVAVGENAVVSAPERRKGKESLEDVSIPVPHLENNVKSSKITYAPLIPLAEKDGVVYLAQLPDVALVDKAELRKKGLTGTQARNAIFGASREKGFASYIMKDKTFVLVPRAFHNRFHRNIPADAFDYNGINLIPKDGLEAYVADRNAFLPSHAKISGVILGGKVYYPQTVVDSFVVPAKKEAVGVASSRERPAEPPRENSPPPPATISSATHVHYTLVEDGLVTIVKDVSLVNKDVFSRKVRISETYASILLGRKIEEHNFALYFSSGVRGGRRRTLLVPRGSEKLLHERLTLDTYEDIALVEKENGQAYADAKGIQHFLYFFLPVVHLSGKEYHFASDIDANAGPVAQISKEARSIDDVAAAPSPIAREGSMGVESVELSKDEDSRGKIVGAEYVGAILGFDEILQRCKINNPALGKKLKDKLPYAIGRSSVGSRKLYFFIAPEMEGNVHPKFSLQEGDVQNYRRLTREEYDALCKQDSSQEKNYQFHEPTGIEFFIPEFVSLMAEGMGKERAVAPTEINQSQGEKTGDAEIIFLETYQPFGTRNGISYTSGTLKRVLFPDDVRARVSKFYEKAGLSTAHLQAEGLELLAQTDYETHYRHPNGEQLSVAKARARINTGEEVNLPVALANAAIMYLADHWDQIAAEEIASRKAWKFEEVTFSVTNGAGRSSAKQKYRVPVVASPNGEYIVGRAAVLQELGLHASKLYAAIPNLLELRVLGAEEGQIGSEQNWIIHQGDVNAIKHAIEYGTLPKNYIGHFAQ